MGVLFLQYPPCTTCKRAKAWLDERGVDYEARNIKEENPTVEELKAWHQKSGLPPHSREGKPSFFFLMWNGMGL